MLGAEEHKFSVWYRYVNDIFVVWKQGKKNLNNFLEHLNKQRSNIHLVMGTEDNGRPPFSN